MAKKSSGGPPPRYPIRAVSRLTGLSVDTLRAWERRHNVVTPVRDDRGRMYSGTDVKRLQLLAAAVDRGHAIGRLAAQSDALGLMLALTFDLSEALGPNLDAALDEAQCAAESRVAAGA